MVRDRHTGKWTDGKSDIIEVGTPLKNMLLKDLPPNEIKTIANNFYLKSY